MQNLGRQQCQLGVAQRADAVAVKHIDSVALWPFKASTVLWPFFVEPLYAMLKAVDHADLIEQMVISSC
jgi:hypothetical protein